MARKFLWRKVVSSNIKKVAHFQNTLYVMFHNGNSVYSYTPVLPAMYNRMMGASSIGSYFIKNIQKNKKIKAKNERLTDQEKELD